MMWVITIFLSLIHIFWYPSEVDVSIRPGWFYHAEQDNQVRLLANLVNIYYRSVGCNSVLLLNIPPDNRGLMHENDVKRIKELTEYIKKTFADNKVEKGNRIWTAKVGDYQILMSGREIQNHNSR